MQGTLKTVSLESCFPLLAVEQGCIVSKNGDLTIAFRVKLPEVFTQTAAEYGCWNLSDLIQPNKRYEKDLNNTTEYFSFDGNWRRSCQSNKHWRMIL